MRPPKRFYIYIMTNGPRSHVLYTGITGNLPRRVFEHKNKLVPDFTSRYNITRLVYYESFAYPDAAIAREKDSFLPSSVRTTPRGPEPPMKSHPKHLLSALRYVSAKSRFESASRHVACGAQAGTR
jgi:predicted GIY-YIG superfamily endonuclease